MANQNVGQLQNYAQMQQNNLTEGDEIVHSGFNQNAMGSSFDSREKVKEIKQRHMAAQIPASKINFKKNSNNQTKNGTTLKVVPVMN